MADTMQGEVLNPGQCRAEMAVLDEPLSFWGGFDPATGTVIDQHHPQAGLALGGKVLVMPGSRGSAGTPAGIAEALRRGCGPVAFLLARRDVNIAVGAMVAGRLYGLAVPVLALGAADYARLVAGATATVTPEGKVEIAGA